MTRRGLTQGGRPRVLVLAEAANPEMVSVPLVGWSLTSALREVADVHLVTQIRNRDAILRAGWSEGRDFTAIDSEAVARPLWRLSQMLGVGGSTNRGWTVQQAITVFSDAYFDRLAWRLFGPEVQAGGWDIVHRVTPLSPVKPSFFGRQAARAGVPFVMGPLNGGVPWPAGYAESRAREGERLSILRGAVRLLPGRTATWRAACAIMAGSRHTAGEIAEVAAQKVIYLPENGIDPTRFTARATSGSRGLPLRAVFVGRMVPYKMPDALVEAAAPLMAEGKLVLDLIGEGPLLGEIRALADKLGVSDRLTLHGSVPHGEVGKIMAGCDVLAFPSIREFGGGVVIDAMAIGLPPLVVDYAGPGEIVQPEWGLKVPIGPRDAVVAGFRATLERLVADPAQLGPLGEAARARAEEMFAWSRKAAQVRQVYDWVLGQRSSRPAPFG